jgi:S1-C subfamily serine protease
MFATATTMLCAALLLVGSSPEEQGFPAKVRTAAVAATVRVDNSAERIKGSGVVIYRDRQHVYLLTAAHVVGRSRQVEVHVAAAQADKPGKPRVFKGATVLAKSSPELDLAVLRLRVAAELPSPVALATVKGAAKVPDRAVSVGWASGDAPTALDEDIRRKAVVRRPGEKAGVLCWQTKRKQVRGRSGGPLVDPAGRVIGLATGHDGESGYYVHVEEAHRFLKKNGLGFLIGDETDR